MCPTNRDVQGPSYDGKTLAIVLSGILLNRKAQYLGSSQVDFILGLWHVVFDREGPWCPNKSVQRHSHRLPCKAALANDKLNKIDNKWVEVKRCMPQETGIYMAGSELTEVSVSSSFDFPNDPWVSVVCSGVFLFPFIGK